MASQTQEIVQIANSTTESTSAAIEDNPFAQRQWQELIAATKIAAAQLKEDNSQDTRISNDASTGSTASNNFTQEAQDDEQAPVIENMITIKEGSGKIKKERRQVSVEESIIQASESSTIESVGATSRTSKKRKANEKVEVSQSSGDTTSLNNRKKHKLAANSMAFSSDLSAITSESQSDENEAEVAEDSFNGVRRRRQVEDESKAAPVERPRRNIRPVVPYGSEAVEQKVRNKKPIEIPQGSGIPLSQIPHVLRAIDKMKTSDDVLKGLHKLIYGRMGSKHDIKNHIRAFSGFKIQTPLDEIVLKEKLEKWKIAGLKDICHLFSLKSSGDKQKVVDRVYDFLKNPRDMTAPNEGNGRNKNGNKKKKSAAVKAKTSIVRKKTARDIFNAEQRPLYKEKAENDSKTRTEIDSLLAEAWKGLAEDNKKLYAEKAAEANKNEPQQKRQNSNKNKAKQPEMVEDSDLSEEEFVTHEEEQKKGADVMNLNSDFSDTPSGNENDEDADAEEDNVKDNVVEIDSRK